jgi:hypothetical protein
MGIGPTGIVETVAARNWRAAPATCFSIAPVALSSVIGAVAPGRK